MMIDFITPASRNHVTLSNLNARRAVAKASLAAAQGGSDSGKQAVASAELIELDEAISTLLALAALRNAEIARCREARA
jgi:hypothetical protein